ncbi:MAG: hypothetical protein FJ014_04550 [Chloroflexi bacterium]|nr:hypothetical protein [Chloroflexota bacterium]
MIRETHIDEAGIDAESPIVVVSVFVVNDAETLRAAIKAVRDRHYFGNEMKSAKTSALRRRVYRDVLTEVMQHDIEVWALIADKKTAIERLGLAQRVLGDYFTELAVMRTASLWRGGVLYLDEKPGKGRDALLQRLPVGLTEVGAVREIDSHQDDLMQVSDLICGTVFGVETGNERKRELFEIIAPRVSIWRWTPEKQKADRPSREVPPNSERHPG